MAYELSFKDAAMEAVFMFAASCPLLSDPQVDAVVERLHTLRAHVDLDTFTFSPDAQSPTLYEYKIRHKDQRRWNQKLDFSEEALDPGQSFNTHGDMWTLSEFEHHRPLRDAIVVLHNWRQVQSIEVTFA